MKTHAVITVVVASLVVFTLVGCKDKNAPSGKSATGQQQRLTIATAGTTGVFYAYGGALASTISKYVPGTTVTAQATGGSVENFKLLGNKEVDLATTSADAAYDAYYNYKNSKYFKNKVEARALFYMYGEPLHLVVRAESRIKGVQDLKGKRVVVGSPGSGTELKSRFVLKTLGIDYKDFTPEFLSFAEGTDALKDQTVDVAMLGVLYPAPAVVELSQHNPIRLISLTDSEVDKVLKASPIFVKAVIPRHMYKGVDADTQTVAVPCLVVSRPDMSDEMAYNIVKTVFEHKDELNLMHSAFKESTLVNSINMVIPLHPGAIKYYKEKGVYKER
ncbi:MAG TPA: TAXI family TRAP transporter solute-binding subunit [Nitrospirota bacterium]|nr:TAXI family TRAP transporter solute-binding subunit [Nitrospirota bacterium]